MAKLVQIQSQISIRVTTGLQNKDVTNPDAHVPDRLKVNPEWPKHMILITKGVGYYPVEIKTWKTVQALAEQKVITIGQEIDKEELDKKESADYATAQEAEKEFRLSDVESTKRRRKSVTLDDIANA